MYPEDMFLKSKKYWEYKIKIWIAVNLLCAESGAEMEGKMKKKIVLRGAVGIPIGITIGYFITIFSSFIHADGYYSPCVPELTVVVGNEIKAVLLQAFLSGLLGAAFGASSIIWEIEHWSLVKQTGIYFGIISVTMMPIAYFLYWMEHSTIGVLSYFGIFVFIFFIVWAVQIIIGKYTVKKINAKIKKD